MFSTILIILVVIIAAILVYAATRPNDFVTSRTASHQGRAGIDLSLINDFKALAGMVALRKARSGDEAHTVRH